MGFPRGAWHIRRLALRSDLRAALESSEGLSDVHRRCAHALIEHLELKAAVVWLRADEPAPMQVIALETRAGSAVVPPEHCCPEPVVRSVEDCVPWQTDAAATHPELSFGGLVDLARAPSFLAYPLLGPDRAIGALGLYSRRVLKARTLELVAWVTDLLAITTMNHRLGAERVRLGDELRQSQKMQALGLLAGGVAHDFNNILTVISGYVEMTLETVELEEPHQENLLEVASAADRARTLVQQLLAFSRRSPGNPKIVDLNVLLAGVRKMLDRLLPADVTVEVEPCAEACLVHADPGQLEQVVVNLAVNARDAMPAGGHLRLTSRLVIFAQGAPEGPFVQPGVYVRLDVSDTGTGMSDEVRSHIFEPFFTTKEIGRGTGLGLSTVYGIVRQNGGFVMVDSRPGHGSRFSVLLPAHDAADSAPAVVAPAPALRGGHEVVLVVEDERAVRRMTVSILKSAGYTVLEAADATEALRLADQSARVDAVIADLVVPGLRGPQLAMQVARRNPRLLVLLMTGDPSALRVDDLPREITWRVLTKPFTPRRVLEELRSALDRA